MPRVKMTWLLAATVLLCIRCAASGTEGVLSPAAGSLVMDVYPNPIMARHVGGNVYDFPFEVSIREVGGVDVDIDAIRVEVHLRGLPIFSQIFDETELTRRGYPATIPASGNVQYRFSPRREVPSEAIFSQVTAMVAISGVDRSGNRTEARAVITVRR